MYVYVCCALFSLPALATMSDFKGFTFEKPISHQSEPQDAHLTDLSLKFNRISTDDNDSRLGSFKHFRSPIASRSRSEAQEQRRLEALELQKQVLMCHS